MPTGPSCVANLRGCGGSLRRFGSSSLYRIAHSVPKIKMGHSQIQKGPRTSETGQYRASCFQLPFQLTSNRLPIAPEFRGFRPSNRSPGGARTHSPLTPLPLEVGKAGRGGTVRLRAKASARFVPCRSGWIAFSNSRRVQPSVGIQRHVVGTRRA